MPWGHTPCVTPLQVFCVHDISCILLPHWIFDWPLNYSGFWLAALVNCLASIPKKAIGLIEFEPKNILDIRHMHQRKNRDGMNAFLFPNFLGKTCIKPGRNEKKSIIKCQKWGKCVNKCQKTENKYHFLTKLPYWWQRLVWTEPFLPAWNRVS